MKGSCLSLTICVLLSAFCAKATASSCLIESPSIELQAKDAPQLMKEAQAPGIPLCRRAQVYHRLMMEFPLDFVRAGLFFKLLTTEKDLGLAQKAVQTYMQWPWQSKYSPWTYISDEEEPSVRLMLFQIFQSTIPSSPSLCIPNPLTARCDEGQGLANYDQQFAERFPGSPLISQMRLAVRPFYLFKMRKEWARLESIQKSYEASFHPRNIFDELADLWQRDRRPGPPALRKCRLGSAGDHGRCFMVFQQNSLSALLIQALHTESFLHEEDRARLRPIIRKYAIEMRDLLRAHPEIKNQMEPELGSLDWDQLIQTHS